MIREAPTQTRRLAALLFLFLAACGSTSPEPGSSEPLGSNASAVTVTHTWDLASRMPNRLAIMFAMSWFGIPTTSGGQDATWGNWKWNDSASCTPTTDPTQCDTSVTSTPERRIASKYRPLAGVYSVTARDTESQRRIELMLSQARRACDSGARIDAWAIQLNNVKFTSAHPSNPQSNTADYAYRALVSFLNQADAAGMTNAVLPGFDSTWYFHFGTSVGLADGDRASRIQATEDDAVDMVNLSMAHPSALKINGKPVLLYYVDSASDSPSVSEWQSIFQNARNRTGYDFYTVATRQNADYFGAFDALSAWVNLGSWSNTSGSTLREHATNWSSYMHSSLFSRLGEFPGRVVFGGLAAGFSDFTQNWGTCTPREIPRDPDLVAGQVDYFISKGIRGVVGQTWDDWTEGSQFEPDVAGGTKMLTSFRQNVGRLYGEAADAAGDTRLDQKWHNYGQARACPGQPVGSSPPSLTCPQTSGTLTGTVTNLQTGGAISGATVSWSGGSATADSSGRYTLSGVSAGTVHVTAQASGYLTRAYDVSVPDGGTATQNIQLSTAGKLVGTVTNGSGTALAGASVRAQGGQIATDVTATTSSTGGYDEGWLAIGSYTVTCSASGYASKSYSATVSTGVTTTVNCTLSNTGTLTGTVTNVQTGGAIAGATVSWSGGSTTADSSGRYTLSGVTAGTQHVTASATGYLDGSLDVNVTAGGTVTQNFGLSTSGKLVGNVRHAGVGISGATVRAQGGQVYFDESRTTDSTGHYDFGWVPIGTYTVTCSKTGSVTQTLTGVQVTTGGTLTADCNNL